MRYLICADFRRRAVIAAVLLSLPVTSVLALKPPENVIHQPSPVPAEPSKATNKKSRPVDVPRTAPARGSSSERVQADSAVSFPVDI